MRFLVHHDGQQLGPFDPIEVRQALNEGRIRDTDLAWYEGLPTWIPVRQALHSATAEQEARYMGGPLVNPPSSGLAITSLILGVATFFFCVLSGIPAIVCGHIARGDIRRSNGRLGGDGMALSGLILGYLSLFLPVAFFGFFLIFAGATTGASFKGIMQQAFKEGAARPEQAINATRQVSQALRNYASDHGGEYPETLEQLVPDYLADKSLLQCPFSPGEEVGYLYYSGKDTDSGDQPLLVTKAKDEHGRELMVKRDGRLLLRKESSSGGTHRKYEIQIDPKKGP